MITYPNQKIITVNKTKCENDFIQVDNKAWQYACTTLSYSAFKIWLYMASNKNHYTFALSYEAINNIIPMSRNTYDNAIKDLKISGYLVQIYGNRWEFNDNLPY